MQFSFSAVRTKMPLRFRKRTTFRNSKTRMDVAGYANYERVWLLGFDVVLQWGIFDPEKPDPARLARATKATL